MTEEKLDTTRHNKTQQDTNTSLDSEKLSADELDAVAGGNSPYSIGIGTDKDKPKPNYPGIVAT